jgi:hypothetical protein
MAARAAAATGRRRRMAIPVVFEPHCTAVVSGFNNRVKFAAAIVEIWRQLFASMQ